MSSHSSLPLSKGLLGEEGRVDEAIQWTTTRAFDSEFLSISESIELQYHDYSEFCSRNNGEKNTMQVK